MATPHSNAENNCPLLDERNTPSPVIPARLIPIQSWRHASAISFITDCSSDDKSPILTSISDLNESLESPVSYDTSSTLTDYESIPLNIWRNTQFSSDSESSVEDDSMCSVAATNIDKKTAASLFHPTPSSSSDTTADKVNREPERIQISGENDLEIIPIFGVINYSGTNQQKASTIPLPTPYNGASLKSSYSPRSIRVFENAKDFTENDAEFEDEYSTLRAFRRGDYVGSFKLKAVERSKQALLHAKDQQKASTLPLPTPYNGASLESSYSPRSIRVFENAKDFAENDAEFEDSTLRAFRRGDYVGSFKLKAVKRSKQALLHAKDQQKASTLPVSISFNSRDSPRLASMLANTGDLARESDSESNDTKTSEQNTLEILDFHDDFPVHKKILTNTKQAAILGIEILNRKDEAAVSHDTCNSDCRCSNCIIERPTPPPNLQFAQSAGFKMMPSFFLPAVPKILEDFWVSLELIATVLDFVFNCVTFRPNPLGILQLVLTLISMILALLDSFLHFIQAGSCLLCFQRCQKWSRRGTQPSKELKNRCQCIPNSWKKKLNTWLNIFRTIISEFVLYPLVVADLTELIEARTYGKTDAENRINFGLFNIGLFYLVVSVYFMRTFMAISSVVNLRRLPKTTNNKYIILIVKFCLHLIGQTLVNASILSMIGTKLQSEICVTNDEISQLSPYFWYEVIAGDALPFLGVILFFLVNYPALKQFSMSFYIDIMSTVMNHSFAELVFEGEGVKTVKRKTKKVAEKADLLLLRSEFENFRNFFTFKGKAIYRLTSPVPVIASTVYVLMVVAFLVCHIFGPEEPCDINSPIALLLFQDVGITITFFLGIVTLVITNYQAVLIVVVLFIIVLSLFVFFVLLPSLAVLLTPIIFVSAMIYYNFRK